MATDLVLILYVWFFSLMLQFMSAPLVMKVTSRYLADAGWGISRVISWLLLALPVWWFSHLKLPLNQTVVFYLLFLLYFGFSLFIIKKNPHLISLIINRRSLIITEEILFFIGLFSLSLIRGFNPAILDLEKFMDAGFMASYLRATTLPAPDIWLAGKTINYYSFGHYLGSVMTRVWQLPLAYSYNLLLGFIMGLGLITSFAATVNLISSFNLKVNRHPALIWGGIIGAWLTVIAGNTHTLWYLLSKSTFKGYWYADATRFIHNTIHEFPSYSFVVSDLHGHVWDFPIVLTFISVMLFWFSQLTLTSKRKLLSFSSIWLGLLVGVMFMTNMWDVLIYGLLVIITSMILFIVWPNTFKSLLLSAILMLGTAAITAAPFFFHFSSISEGIVKVSEGSPVWQLGVLWTGHVFLSLLSLLILLAVLWRRSRLHYSLKLFITNRRLVMLGINLSAWLLLLIPELIYVKDIYTGHPRANTMFKLTYQAFILMSLSGGFAGGFVWYSTRFKFYEKWLITASIVTVIGGLSLFPYFSYRDYYGGLKTYKGLYGLSWLKDQSPGDYQAVLWLNQNVRGQPVILESWGESYTTFDRISAFTGLPTVIGWRVHEWLWRGGFDIPGARSNEVDLVYTEPNSPKAKNILEIYQVKYLIVGTKEREAYPHLDEAALLNLGTEVFRSDGTIIIALD